MNQHPQLLLMRHAKAANPGGVADHQRPLAHRGERDADRAGAWLAAHDLLPDLVLCSDAARTRQTAELVIAGAGADVAIRPLEELYSAHVAEVVAVLHDLAGDADGPRPQRVLVVGHEPTTSATIAELTGQWTTCPTAAIAVIALTASWDRLQGGSGDLEALWTPS